MLWRSCHAIWVKEHTQRPPLQRSSGSKPLSKAKTFHDTIVTFLRFIAAQTATSPLEEIEELKAGMRQCWMCTTSVKDDALSFHQIAVRGTARLKSSWHDLRTVVAILFTLTGFTEERSSLRVRDDWKLLSPSHLPGEVRSSSKSLHRKPCAVHSRGVRGKVCDGKRQITF